MKKNELRPLFFSPFFLHEHSLKRIPMKKKKRGKQRSNAPAPLRAIPALAVAAPSAEASAKWVDQPPSNAAVGKRMAFRNVHLLSIFATIIFMLALIKYNQESLPAIVIMILAPVFYTSFFLTAATLKAQTESSSPSEVGRRSSGIYVHILVSQFIVLLTGVVCSLLIGIPLEMRHYLSRNIIVRNAWKSKIIELHYHPGTNLNTRKPFIHDSREAGDRELRQLIWEEWLFLAATANNTKSIILYKSDVFQNYYAGFSGKLIFPEISKEAKLADCVGFIVRRASRIKWNAFGKSILLRD